MPTTLLERPDGLRIIQLTDSDDATPFLASFAGAYQTIFSEPPYNERFSPDEAAGVLLSCLQSPGNLSLLALEGTSKVVGFGLALPMWTRHDIVRELQGLIPIRHSFYLAELGVLERYRGSGLGQQLISMRLDRINRQRFTHAVLRVSATKNASYDLYLRLGFDDMGVYMEVPSLRINGRENTDRRLFLARVLDAPDESSLE